MAADLGTNGHLATALRAPLVPGAAQGLPVVVYRPERGGAGRGCARAPSAAGPARGRADAPPESPLPAVRDSRVSRCLDVDRHVRLWVPWCIIN